MSAATLAGQSGLPEPTVAKVLKALGKSPLVISSRGVRGGYMIGMPASVITAADIITLMDGPVSLTACVDGGHTGCSYEAKCPVKGRWDTVNAAVLSALQSVTLADMIQPRFKSNNTPYDFMAEQRV